MSSITRNNFSIHSNLKGNLLKTEYQKDGIVYFVKSGRLQVRDFPEKWGIEPVIEVLCYEIGKLMGLNVAEQSLIGMEGIRYGKNFRTLVCSSPDFRNGKTLIYLASLYAEDESNIDFEKLCRNTGCGNNLINLLAFDLIIMNEDRHNSNIGFLMSDNGELKLSPIYDNGYSLLYDDIKGVDIDRIGKETSNPWLETNADGSTSYQQKIDEAQLVYYMNGQKVTEVRTDIVEHSDDSLSLYLKRKDGRDDQTYAKENYSTDHYDFDVCIAIPMSDGAYYFMPEINNHRSGQNYIYRIKDFKAEKFVKLPQRNDSVLLRNKDLLIVEGAGHAQSYLVAQELCEKTIIDFMNQYIKE